MLKAEKLKKEGILDKLRPKYVVLGCWSGLPDRELLEALADHPGIILADGLQAINRYEVPTRDYQARHLQPSAHQAFAREVVNMIREK